jgi:RimJ/RimL family protein N-acetyltransferase
MLRPFAPEDAPELQRLAGLRDVADTMISIPHPYPDGEAARSIARYAGELREGRAAHCAITLRQRGQIIGAIELRDIDPEHSQAELSLWIAPPWWNQGYATEAVGAMLQFGFEQVGVNRIYAHHMTRNPASGRVLAKTGFRREGLLRQRVRKWDVFEDVVALAILRQDWEARAADGA